MLYGELADEIVPWTWEAWLADDLWRFADYAIERSLWVASETFATGLHLSMLCTEGISSTTDQQVQTLTAGTLLGPELINRYRAACSDWPIGTLPPGFHDPVSSFRWVVTARTVPVRSRRNINLWKKDRWKT
jgi:hypothetical protein